MIRRKNIRERHISSSERRVTACTAQLEKRLEQLHHHDQRNSFIKERRDLQNKQRKWMEILFHISIVVVIKTKISNELRQQTKVQVIKHAVKTIQKHWRELVLRRENLAMKESLVLVRRLMWPHIFRVR